MSIIEDLLRADGSQMLQVDGWLEPYRQVLIDRWGHFRYHLARIHHELGGMLAFTDRSNYGLFVDYEGRHYQLSEFDQFPRDQAQPFLVYREWVGNARSVALCGDFNGWDTEQHKSEAQEFGVHTIRVPFVRRDGLWECPIRDGQKYKVHLVTHQGERLWRQPLYCNNMVYNDDIKGLEPVFKTTPKFHFRAPQPDAAQTLRIYECHIGMAGEEGRVHSYREFADDVLPRVVAKHYNCIQVMAVQEHAYYASFGYQVTSFFAASSRFGGFEDFKYLVERAHESGVLVLLDLVHSHASKNEADGISRYDGTDFFFHPGDHPLWDSKVFNFEFVETQRYMLQNVRFWLDEFNVDGFRFDGIMSMMYWHRSAGVGYTGRYGEYFEDGNAVDNGGLTYLRLCHTLLHELAARTGRRYVTIAEDVSGYPGLATPLADGGVGFTYRFQMAAPDLWVSMMKRGFDEGLLDGAPDGPIDVARILHALTNRRHQERHIIYCECHDQALVGDKTLLMWLLNEKIYTDMSALQPQQPRTMRGVALHKVIRALTCSLGGEGYLNFMGNEFGHPEWIDFPRRENGWSFHCCRRQWHLEDEDHTRYHQLGRFDRALMALAARTQWARAREYCTLHDQGRHLMCYDRGDVFVVASLHHSTLENVLVPVRAPGTYRLVLNSEEAEFGGFQDAAAVDRECAALRTMHYTQMDDWGRGQLNGQQWAVLLPRVLCRTVLFFEVERDE